MPTAQLLYKSKSWQGSIFLVAAPTASQAGRFTLSGILKGIAQVGGIDADRCVDIEDLQGNETCATDVNRTAAMALQATTSNRLCLWRCSKFRLSMMHCQSCSTRLQQTMAERHFLLPLTE